MRSLKDDSKVVGARVVQMYLTQRLRVDLVLDSSDPRVGHSLLERHHEVGAPKVSSFPMPAR